MNCRYYSGKPAIRSSVFTEIGIPACHTVGLSQFSSSLPERPGKNDASSVLAIGLAGRMTGTLEHRVICIDVDPDCTIDTSLRKAEAELCEG